MGSGKGNNGVSEQVSSPESPWYVKVVMLKKTRLMMTPITFFLSKNSTLL